MMGRPIGLRDEACDLRLTTLKLPARIPDDVLESASPGDISQTSHIDYGIHFFKLGMIVSEIKYVLHSVRRKTPTWALRAIRDVVQWQDSVKDRLDEWCASIPEAPRGYLEYGAAICRIQYNTTRMLLMLPTPGIPLPRLECLSDCYDSSISAIRLFDELYADDMLIDNWSTLHSVILHAFCLLYCFSTSPKCIADASTSKASREGLIAALRAASNILSATGEYWAGAKRNRDLLNDLASKVLFENAESTIQPSGKSSNRATTRETGARHVHGISPRSDGVPTHGSSGEPQTHDGPSEMGRPQHSSPGFPLESLFDGFGSQDSGADFLNNYFDFGSLFVNEFDLPGVENAIPGLGLEF
ncbi:hypothetical protein LTR87_017078 [Friedmanniomyces endolithicus]|nr:hypothetical protein LTR87_017078 [Friedmanniomyces endolithicus]